MKFSDQVKDYVRRLHPGHRHTLKTALLALDSGKSSDTEPLTGNLEGFYRLRVGKFRIIYRHNDDSEIECVFIETRNLVYERFLSMREQLGEN